MEKKVVLFYSKHLPTQGQVVAAQEKWGATLHQVPATEEVPPDATPEEVRRLASCDADRLNSCVGVFTPANTEIVGVILAGGLPEFWLWLLPELNPGFRLFTSTTRREVVESPEGPDGKKNLSQTFKHIAYRPLPRVRNLLTH